ncbi:MAG: hypothetical protein WC777_02135 [Candidatus Gracilibacteria bacterium]
MLECGLPLESCAHQIGTDQSKEFWIRKAELRKDSENPSGHGSVRHLLPWKEWGGFGFRKHDAGKEIDERIHKGEAKGLGVRAEIMEHRKDRKKADHQRKFTPHGKSSKNPYRHQEQGNGQFDAPKIHNPKGSAPPRGEGEVPAHDGTQSRAD